ncbi:sedoheptulose 7-phosphate cyclase [Nocardia sp. NPDC006630]|uniref:sedoheptulose 7-phosphate cyclase n=1 Tax=Nocardia sp. NPDC006630 TaxID=3157181 RepID=UPI0033B8CA23
MDRTWTVREDRTVSYSITRTSRCLDPGNRDLAKALGTDRRRTLVVVDATVLAHFGDAIEAYFHDAAASYTILTIEAAERTKTAETVGRIVREYDRFSLSRRRDAVVAIGGGVLTDVVGFASSIYRRGVPYVRVPTTLLGMVDAAVGAKTGINVGKRKNRVGTYYPAVHTVVDPHFLATLPDRQIANGMAEILKIALIKDVGLFHTIEQRWSSAHDFATNTAVAGPVIDAAISAILEELEGNLFENNLARAADFGHTFSPSFELAAQPILYHGEAVAIDIALSCLIARERGLFHDQCFDRVADLMTRIGLPLHHECITEDLLAAGLEDSVRHRDGAQNIPLPTGIGDAEFAQDIALKEVVAAADSLRSMSQQLSVVR